MDISSRADGSTTFLTISGRLDTTTAPQLEEFLSENLNLDIERLEWDFSNLEYLSSAGLRVLLSTQKKMMRQGEMVITNVNDEIMEVFEITGFTDILTIE